MNPPQLYVPTSVISFGPYLAQSNAKFALRAKDSASSDNLEALLERAYHYFKHSWFHHTLHVLVQK